MSGKMFDINLNYAPSIHASESCKHARRRKGSWCLLTCSSPPPLQSLEYMKFVSKVWSLNSYRTLKNWRTGASIYIHRISITIFQTEMHFAAFLTAVKSVTNMEKNAGKHAYCKGFCNFFSQDSLLRKKYLNLFHKSMQITYTKSIQKTF